MKSNEMIEIPKEVYEELLAIEEEYLQLKNMLKSNAEHLVQFLTFTETILQDKSILNG